MVFTLREPSGRTFRVDKGRLQRAILRVPLGHLCLFPCLGSPMNDGRNGDACCVRMLLLFPQPASCCLGTFRGIRQPQPNGTYSKDVFWSIYFSSTPPCHGFWLWANAAFFFYPAARCIRLISAPRICRKSGRDLG